MSKKRPASKPTNTIVKLGDIAMSDQNTQSENVEQPTSPISDVTTSPSPPVDAPENVEAKPTEPIVEDKEETKPKETKPDNVYSFIANKYPALSDKTKLPLMVQSIIERLDLYVKGMGNNVPVVVADAVKFQKSLYNCFNVALDAKDGQHVLALDVICWYIAKHRDSAFSDRLAARFLEAEQFSNGVQAKFVAILNVLTIVSNPANRGKINKLVNMDSVSRTLNNTGLALTLSNYVAAAR